MYTRRSRLKSRLSRAKRLRLLEHFVAGTTARAAAELVGVNRNTVNRFYLALRQIIAEEMEKAAPLHGEVEVDESYFGGKRKGKRGRGAAGKVPVFGLLKLGGRVYTLPIPNAKARMLMPIIKSRVVPYSIVYTDNFASYDVIDVSTFHHRRIDHAKAFAEGKGNERHINGIENFWNQAKRHLRRRAESPGGASTTSSRNASGVSTVVTTRSFIAGCWDGPGGRGCLSRPASKEYAADTAAVCTCYLILFYQILRVSLKNPKWGARGVSWFRGETRQPSGA